MSGTLTGCLSPLPPTRKVVHSTPLNCQQGVDIHNASLSVVVTNADGWQPNIAFANNHFKQPRGSAKRIHAQWRQHQRCVLRVSIAPVDIRSMRIWDRWGKMVYDGSDGAGEWDGTFKDKPAMVGCLYL